jgi:hypothetical protein
MLSVVMDDEIAKALWAPEPTYSARNSIKDAKPSTTKTRIQKMTRRVE